MAYIKVVLDYAIQNGESITFKAPCNCTAIKGLKVYYNTITENNVTQTSKVFTFKDAHGNTLTGIGNLFEANALIKVVLDTTNKYAYIQNADTNGYLENKLNRLNEGIGTLLWSGDVEIPEPNEIENNYIEIDAGSLNKYNAFLVEVGGYAQYYSVSRTVENGKIVHSTTEQDETYCARRKVLCFKLDRNHTQGVFTGKKIFGEIVHPINRADPTQTYASAIDMYTEMVITRVFVECGIEHASEYKYTKDRIYPLLAAQRNESIVGTPTGVACDLHIYSIYGLISPLETTLE